MELPMLHRKGYEKTADKEKDDVIKIKRCNGFAVHDAQEWEQRDG
jgi:hypothetical protein